MATTAWERTVVMPLSEWKTRAFKVARAHVGRRSNSYRDVSVCLLELHELMVSAPAPIHVEYAHLSESDLMRGRRQRIDRIVEGDLSWQHPSQATADGWALAIGRQIRVLDETLAIDFREHRGALFEPQASELGRAPWHIVPRPRPRREVVEARNMQPYARRGVLLNRLIPTVAQGYAIEIEDVRSLDLEGQADTTLGAALAPGLELTIRQRTNGFRVEGIHYPGAVDAIDRCLAEAAQASCDIVAWPELTIGPVERDHIKTRLVGWPLDSPRPPILTVAGSCHETYQHRHVNASAVFDLAGRNLARHEKISPFGSYSYGSEDIDPGRKITVMVTERLIVAVAICKDFCDLGHDSPYLLLDVDLIVVPSMGTKQTAAGHVAFAKMLRNRTGALAFVVQQPDPHDEPENPACYVMPATTDLGNGPAPFVQSEAWEHFPGLDIPS